MGDVIDRTADGGGAEQHVAVAGKVACVAGAVGRRSPDDEVVEAVAVDVAGRGDRLAGQIVDVLPVDDEPADAGRNVGEVDLDANLPALPNTT